jgi:hypothetical protein
MSNRKNGHAVALLASPDPKPEKVAQVESLMLPAALLLAAESISLAKPSPDKAFLGSIYLHVGGGKGRIASTDGGRLFLASFTLPQDVPSWLTAGLLLDADGLKSRVGLLTKLGSSESEVRISFASGAITAELSDKAETARFRIGLQSGTFPDYERILSDRSFASLDADGEQAAGDWQPIGINSSFLKQCGELAKLLEGGLDKSQRSKLGMVVRAFTGGDANAPLVFDFSTWPGALLVVMPVALPSPNIAKETAALLAPALRASLAALRAHATRNTGWAEAATDPGAKAAFEQKAKAFEQRIADLMKRAPVDKQIGASPAPEAGLQEPSPAPQAEDAPAPAPASDRTRTRRTRIKVEPVETSEAA